MGQDLLIDLPDEVIGTLKLEAELQGCSLEERVREILAAHADQSSTTAKASKQD